MATLNAQSSSHAVDMLGAEEWKSLFNHTVSNEDFEMDRRIRQHIEEIFRKNTLGCPFNPDQKLQNTHTLLMVPAGISLKQLGGLAQNQPRPTQYDNLDDDPEIMQQLGHQQVEKSYWILITNTVVSNTKMKSFEEQKRIVSVLGKDQYRLPRPLEMAILIFMKHKSGQKCDFGRDPYTYSRCLDEIHTRVLEATIKHAQGTLTIGRIVHDNEVETPEGLKAIKEELETHIKEQVSEMKNIYGEKIKLEITPKQMVDCHEPVYVGGFASEGLHLGCMDGDPQEPIGASAVCEIKL